MNAINKRTREAGVVWQPCQSCGRDWPFPVGAGSNPVRELLCPVCANAATAKLQRILDTYIHHEQLIEQASRRGITDCSTPLFVRVQNLNDMLMLAEQEVVKHREAVIDLRREVDIVLVNNGWGGRHAVTLAHRISEVLATTE